LYGVLQVHQFGFGTGHLKIPQQSLPSDSLGTELASLNAIGESELIGLDMKNYGSLEAPIRYRVDYNRVTRYHTLIRENYVSQSALSATTDERMPESALSWLEHVEAALPEDWHIEPISPDSLLK
jgi:hypothetical protein